MKCRVLLLLTATAVLARADNIRLILPTANIALLDNKPAEFYQFVDREFKGVKSTPWEGGCYGFVRNPVETPAGIIHTRFHEGVDIRPLRRDDADMPVDPVRAIADGRVVYVNDIPQFSNYGRYVVIDHEWHGCHYYSLFAHLNSIAVTVGRTVKQGDIIGVLGFTGSGIDLRRAHLHFELNLMLSLDIDAWHRRHFPEEPNRHGLYNGLNLTGIDVAGFYLALRDDPTLTVPRWVKRQDPFYKVILPAQDRLALARFYPWLVEEGRESAPAAWEISFDRSGLPLQMKAADAPVSEPKLVWIKPANTGYDGLTRGVIRGSGKKAALSDNGMRLMSLLVGDP